MWQVVFNEKKVADKARIFGEMTVFGRRPSPYSEAIFSADETGCFCQVLLDRTMHIKGIAREKKDVCSRVCSALLQCNRHIENQAIYHSLAGTQSLAA